MGFWFCPIKKLVSEFSSHLRQKDALKEELNSCTYMHTCTCTHTHIINLDHTLYPLNVVNSGSRGQVQPTEAKADRERTSEEQNSDPASKQPGQVPEGRRADEFVH